MISIFELLVYTCITSMHFDGSLASKSCTWEQSGSRFRTETACKEKADAKLGETMHSFYGARIIENAKCMELQVIDE